MYSFPTWKVGNAETVKLTDSDEGTSNQLKPGEIAGKPLLHVSHTYSQSYD